jgi:hypothetical protein
MDGGKPLWLPFYLDYVGEEFSRYVIGKILEYKRCGIWMKIDFICGFCKWVNPSLDGTTRNQNG